MKPNANLITRTNNTGPSACSFFDEENEFQRKRSSDQSDSTTSSPSKRIQHLFIPKTTQEQPEQHDLFSPIQSNTIQLTSTLLRQGVDPKVILTPIPFHFFSNFSSAVSVPVPTNRYPTISSLEEHTPLPKLERLADKTKQEEHETRFSETSSEEGEGSSLSLKPLPDTNSSSSLNVNTIHVKAGERRLNIDFENLGELGKYPQTYGKKGMNVIPNGLCGTHMIYNERWRFEIRHAEAEVFELENGIKCVCIIWIVQNLTSGMVHIAHETKHEAFIRMSVGHTICSRIFRDAFEFRAKQLEEEIENLGGDSRLRITNLKSKIKTLRPRRFSEGTLSFGLQHALVQDRFVKYLLDHNNKTVPRT